jgi:hypothetical protein
MHVVDGLRIRFAREEEAMNLRMKTLLASALAAMATFAAGNALAGSKFTGDGNVRIVSNADGSGSAVGYLGMIYNGPLMSQWIGCQRSEGNSIFCHAKNEAGVVVGCHATSALLAQSVSSISPDARVAFFWSAQGNCIRLQVTHSSEFADKQG